MARGTQESNKTYFKIGYEGGDRDNGAPFFGEQKKVGDHYESVSADTFLEGKLTDIVKGTYKYIKGKQELTQHTFDLTITDGEDNYNLGVNCAYYTRSVLNSLSPITDFSNTIIRLEIYRNGDGFVNIAVKINGERSDWELKPADLPKSDNEKWIASFEYFINKIKANLPKKEALDMTSDIIEANADFAKAQENKPTGKETLTEEITASSVDNPDPISGVPF